MKNVGKGLKQVKQLFILIMILSILFPFNYPFYFEIINGLSRPNVVLSDYRPYAYNVEYTISFTTASDKGLSAGDYVQIHFYQRTPAGDVLAGAIVNEGIQNYSSWVTVNGSTSGGIITASQTQAILHFWVPNNWTSPITNITVKILSTANFRNLGPGDYWLSINTSQETNPQMSNVFTISNPKLQSVAVSVSPPYARKNARYTIDIKTSNYDSSALTSGDNIYVNFPTGTTLPTSIPQNVVSFKYGNMEKFVSVASVSGTSVNLEVPSGISIPQNSYFTIVFYEGANILNPATPKKYVLSVETRDSNGNIKDALTDSAEYEISSTSISNLSVKIEPSQIGAVATYTIAFKTSSSGNLVSNLGEIHIKFPDNASFFIPPTISSSQVVVNNASPYRIDIFGKEIKIITSQAISANSDVVIVIQSSAGIKNPTETGNYKLSIWTSSDLTPVDTAPFTIGPSSVNSVKVTVTPQIASVQAMYVIAFQTGSFGALTSGDAIKIKFPQETYVPASIEQSKVKVNNQSVAMVSVSNNTIIITLQFAIPSGYTVAVQLSSDSGIKNPSSPRSYTVSVSTSKEIDEVQSAPYEIIKGATTSLIVSPQFPNGENGYYISVPKIEIKGDAPQGLSYSIYYKWDDAANYERYSSPISAPEGVHSLSYYASDSYGNKEQVHIQQFKVDTQKPSLVINSPEPNKTFFEKSILIMGTAEPNSTLTVSYSSNTAQIQIDSEGKFQYSFVFLNEGDTTLTFTVKDLAGNTNQVVLPIKYVFQRNIMLIVGKTTSYVNGVEVSINESPFIYKSRVLVPVRFVSETLGADVKWDSIFKIVTITLNGKVLRLQVGNTTADLNGKATQLDVAPVVRNGITFVPIRFISEAFGARVDWDSVHGIVIIVYPKNK